MRVEETLRLRRAAELLLLGLVIQIGGALALSNLTMSTLALQIVNLVFFALSAAGLYLPGCRLGCVGALMGIALTVLTMLDAIPLSMLATNAVYLIMYLPAQSMLDRALEVHHASALTRTLGRRWIWTLIIGRVLSCGAVVMPLLAGAEQAAIAQNKMTFAFQALLALEVVALVATVVSYVYQARYFWRARGVFSE